LSFGSLKIRGLVDTGAQATLLSFPVFAVIANQTKLLSSEDEIYTTFTSASGTLMKPVGLYAITLTMDEVHNTKVTHPFYVIKVLHEECILGIDFITKFDLVLHPSQRLLHYSVVDETVGRITHTIKLDDGLTVSSIRVSPKHSFDISHIKSVSDRNHLEAFFDKHKFAFAYSMADLRCAIGVEHAINTIGAPVTLPIRRLAHTLRPIVKDQIDSMLANGIIRESCSPWSSPIVMTPKKAPGEWRFCVDYRLLNKQTIPDKYPIPRIDDALSSLYGSRFFTSLDLFAGYHQIMVKPEHQVKTAFICEFGLYEYIRLPFGLCSGPATFQRFLNYTLRSVLYKFALCYLDDVLVFSRTFSEHIEHLSVVAKLIFEAGLRFHPKKCFFAKELLEYLGHIISTMGIMPDPKKLKAIVDFPAPMNVKQTQSFLGMVNFYRKYVHKISEIAHPLTQLTRKSVPWTWGEPEEAAFQSLKRCLTSPPILGYPDWSRSFHIYCDASDTGIGSILCQLQDPHGTGRDEEVTIAYNSKHLSDRERKYSTVEKELFSIVHAVTVYRPYIYGQKFLIYSDHRPLSYLYSKKEPAGRLGRWALKLQEYQMEVVYKPGKDQKADCLSRVPVSTIQAVFSTLDTWVKAQRNDNFGKKIINDINSNGNKKRFKILSNGLLATIDERVYVPKEFRTEVLYLNHDHKLAAHLGIAKTLAKIVKRFYWPGLYTDVSAHVNTCIVCAKHKPQGTSRAPLQPIPVVERVWEMVSMDILGPLPITARNNQYALLHIDFATRYVVGSAMVDQTAKTVAKHFVNDVILIFGCPERILSDQGRQFMSDFFRNTCSLCNIDQLRTTSYHPMGNGACERQNRTFARMIACLASQFPEIWDLLLGAVLLALNTSLHSSTHYSSFELMFGRDAILPTDLFPRLSRSLNNDDLSISDLWSTAILFARENMVKSQITQKRYYDRNTTPKEFEEGQQVLLRLHPMPGKFLPKFTGPFKIIRKFSALVYEIQNLETNKIKIVHFNRIKRWEGRTDDKENTVEIQPEVDPNGREREVHSRGAPRRIRGRPRKVRTAKATSAVQKAGNLRESSPSVIRHKRRGHPRKPMHQPTDVVVPAINRSIGYERYSRLSPKHAHQIVTDDTVQDRDIPLRSTRSHRLTNPSVVSDPRNAWVPRYALRSRAVRP